jgi:hypothetical protein
MVDLTLLDKNGNATGDLTETEVRDAMTREDWRAARSEHLHHTFDLVQDEVKLMAFMNNVETHKILFDEIKQEQCDFLDLIRRYLLLHLVGHDRHICSTDSTDELLKQSNHQLGRSVATKDLRARQHNLLGWRNYTDPLIVGQQLRHNWLKVIDELREISFVNTKELLESSYLVAAR